MPDEVPKSVRQFPASAVLSKWLEQQLPGTSTATRKLREEILSFSFDLTARTVFLQGPIGAGKSTIARLIAFAKRTAPLKHDDAQQLVGDLRFSAPGLIDEKLMHWYVELALTGLVETLAESQLFGIGKGVASEVRERAGVFEIAQSGRVAAGSPAVRLTGGVVFLDEIAELSQALQAKLLPVLSGGVFHRVGVESKDLSYRGITIAASWRNISETLRPDLVSRITDRIIVVPGLAERGDDVVAIIDRLQSDLIDRYRQHVQELARDASVDRTWVLHASGLVPLGTDAMKALASVRWDDFGNMRGLTLAIRQMLFGGKELKQVLRDLERLEEGQGGDRPLIEQLFRRSPDGSGLANHVRELEKQQRRKLREQLMSDSQMAEQLLRHLGLDPKKVAHQVQQLDRNRRRTRKVVSQ